LLKKSIDRFKERQEVKTVSLNLEQRQALKQADDDFAKSMDAERDRLAKGQLRPLTKVKLDSVLKPRPRQEAREAQAEEGDTDAADSDNEAKLDIPLRETLRVVNDALHLTDNPLAWVGGRPPRLNKG
jgi:carboxyl-terminal processing protease